MFAFADASKQAEQLWASCEFRSGSKVSLSDASSARQKSLKHQTESLQRRERAVRANMYGPAVRRKVEC
jgi:hypothetical protein